MASCTYTGLKGLVLDKMPEKDFIEKFSAKDLAKVTRHYANNVREGISCCYWGLGEIDNAMAVDLSDGISIRLNFEKEEGIYVPKTKVCNGNSCENIDDNQAAMRDLLSQCLPFIPFRREGHYFMLTPFEKGCCEFKAGIINVKLEDIKRLI